MDFIVKIIILIFLMESEGFRIDSTRNFEKCDYEMFDKLISTLYRNVQVMSTRPSQLNTDAAFGLALSDANLDVILNSKYQKYLDVEYLNRILETRQLSDETRQFIAGTLITKKDRIFSEVFMNSDIWIRPINWHRTMVMQQFRPLITNLDNMTAESFIFDGTPQENESDYCLLQMIKQHLNNKFCQLSNECADILLMKETPHGYPITHRLLIIQLANVLNCIEHPATDFQGLIKTYCEHIYEDLRDLEDAGFPYVGVDLAIEQIFVCGVEGYSVFTTKHYKNLVLSWASVFGCYSSHGTSSRIKRSSTPMDFGCDSHTSGVAAAALSLLLRECIDNNNWIM